MGVTHQEIEELHERHNTHSIPNLIRELRDEGIVLVRQELELAKTEVSEKASRVARNSAYIGIGGAVIFAGFLCLLGAATTALTIGLLEAGIAEWSMPLAALIFGALTAIIGAILAYKGKRTVAQESPVPEKTVESLKEDKRWAEHKIRAGKP